MEDTQPADNAVFPVKPVEKRSYSQNCVVWIKQAGLQSDIQKVLRHAKKLPEKTQNFYKVRPRLLKKKPKTFKKIGIPGRSSTVYVEQR